MDDIQEPEHQPGKHPEFQPDQRKTYGIQGAHAYGDEQRISDDYVENIFHAAPLHDIGKVGIADSILLKPGKHTVEEFEIMKTHALIGANTLETVRSRYPKNAFVNAAMDLPAPVMERICRSGTKCAQSHRWRPAKGA